MELSNVNWNAARKSVLVLGAGAFAHAIVKKNPIMPAVLYGMHLAEYLIVARKAGKAVWLFPQHPCLRLHLLASHEARNRVKKQLYPPLIRGGYILVMR